MRRRYETIAELQEVCKEYNLYSAFESKLTRNMAFKTACEKGFAGIVIFYFDHRRELLNKALINEGREIARENGCDEIISLFYDYTGQAGSDKVKGLIKFKNKEILVFTRVSLFFGQFLKFFLHYIQIFLQIYGNYGHFGKALIYYAGHTGTRLWFIKGGTKMKAFKIAVRFILALALALFNFYVNALFIRNGIYYLRGVGGFWPSVGCFALFAYIFYQMWLLVYILYRNLKKSCIKYNVPYR